MDVYTARPFYLKIANFCMAVAHLRKHRPVGKVGNVPKGIVYIKRQHFLYPTCAKGIKSDCCVNAVHYNSEPHSLDQMAKQEAGKERVEGALEKDWFKDVQLPAKFEEHHPAFLDIVKEFQSMWDGHLEHIFVAKLLIDLISDEVWPVHFTLYQAMPAARQFTTAEMNPMLSEKVIEPVTRKWAAPVVFATNKQGSLRICVHYSKVKIVKIFDSYFPSFACTNILKA